MTDHHTRGEVLITLEMVMDWLTGSFLILHTPNQQTSRHRHAQVLWWRFCDPEPRSRQWVAEQLGRTNERVRQMEAKGLRLLRHPSRLTRIRRVDGIDVTRLYRAIANDP